MTTPKISVVLATYNRPSAIQKQINAVWDQTLKAHELIIAHVENEETKNYDFEDFQVVRFKQDPGLRFKFLASTAVDPDTDVVSILDDDNIPGSKWLENCWETMQQKDSCVVGGLGMDYTDDYYEHASSRNVTHDSWKSVSAIGQMWFMPYNALWLYLENQCPLDVFSGTDDLWFSHVMHKWGIHTLVPSRPEDDKELWHNKEVMRDGSELSQDYRSHREDRKKIIEYVKEHC